jgi:hypothetical protein
MAIAAAVLVLVTAVAPHVHDGALGRHACAACVTAGGAVASSETPEVEPLATRPERLVLRPTSAVAPGFPVGAVRGQSPPQA